MPLTAILLCFVFHIMVLRFCSLYNDGPGIIFVVFLIFIWLNTMFYMEDICEMFCLVGIIHVQDIIFDSFVFLCICFLVDWSHVICFGSGTIAKSLPVVLFLS